MLKLIAWERLLGDMSSPVLRPRRNTTYFVAHVNRGFTHLEAIVASILMNCEGEDLRNRLKNEAARDPADKRATAFARIMVFMRLAEIEKDTGADVRYRHRALELAREHLTGANRDLVVAWIECHRFINKDVLPIAWDICRDYLSRWLLHHGQREAVALTLRFAKLARFYDHLGTGELIIEALKHYERERVVFPTTQEMQEADRLLTSIERRRRRLRLVRSPMTA